MEKIITVLLIFISMAVGTFLIWCFEKWFWIGLVVIYVPLYCLDRNIKPRWNKPTLDIFKTQHLKKN